MVGLSRRPRSRTGLKVLELAPVGLHYHRLVQIVYLSNRPEVLQGTVEAVARWMPWITSILVSAPTGTTFEPFPLRATVVDDAEITGLSQASLSDMNHVSRNVTLRRAMLDNGLLDDDFVLSDDDYRPLVDIAATDYVLEDGRHQGYWFYELENWPGRETDYDLAQIRTLAVLRILDAPTLAYGAHMPQIMHRDWLSEAFKAGDDVGAGPMIDEWSLYFNIASSRHPEAFADPAPFRTLAWPEWPHQWRHRVVPHPIRFENHYPAHEQVGGLFHGLPPITAPDGALTRIEAWRSAELAIGELRFDPAWNDPWTRGSEFRRRGAKALRAAKKLRRYIGLDR
jgi:hypothetical protein